MLSTHLRLLGDYVDGQSRSSSYPSCLFYNAQWGFGCVVLVFCWVAGVFCGVPGGLSFALLRICACVVIVLLLEVYSSGQSR